ncbi:CHAT domain-containing protein, partial [bacterium]|nr:CHAT domain-containing protein [bacterium]
MKAKLTTLGDDLLCQCDAGEQRIPCDHVLESLQAQAKAYDNCLLRRSDDGLLEIGRTLFTLLDYDGWLSRWREGGGPSFLEIQVANIKDSFALALLDAPWELLADSSAYLVDDPVQGLQVVRRLGAAGDAWKPSWGNLRLMFMAAAPEGVGALQYEAEEAGILDATGELDASLLVEESGNAHQLGLRLTQDGPCEALHLSCHGNIDPKRGAVLALEDDVGEKALATVGDLMGELGDPSRLPLVFLSACRSAETDTDGAAKRPHEPLARELVRGGVANVLGWDGSVYDSDAKDFASVFYDALAHGRDVVAACAMARADLRQRCINGEGGDHWHMARLYVGPSGGGALVDTQKARHSRLAENAASEFLDTERGQSPVADRRSFVGRRRELRASLKALKSRTPGKAGVLLHGMGNLGKSSLAARIAQRMTQHKTVVIFGRYDVLAVFDRLCNALPPEKREAASAQWRAGLTDDPQRFALAVEDLLENRLGDQAVLLIVDDLERILETPQAGETITKVKADYSDMLRALLSVFACQRSASRLLLTSRFTFTLGDGAGGDLAQKLVAVPLTPMGDADRAKQWRIQVRGDERDDDKLALLQRAALLAGGNPGLQAVLSKPVLSGEAAVALEAMESLQRFKDSGEKPPAGDALSEF